MRGNRGHCGGHDDTPREPQWKDPAVSGPLFTRPDGKTVNRPQNAAFADGAFFFFFLSSFFRRRHRRS